jgi:hypothetical protein
VPDYGRGSYSALLTLRALQRFTSASADGMTFTTAMNLSFDGMQREVDFIAWRDTDHVGGEYKSPPQLVIGETKSLGQGQVIMARDLAKLKSVSLKLPNAVIVISVLRDHFTHAELKLIVKFANWGRRVNIHGEPTNPVVLLTAHELTMDHSLSETWKDLGGIHAQFSDYEHTRTLLNIADATQKIYLGLPSFHQVRHEYWAKRRARRDATKK